MIHIRSATAIALCGLCACSTSVTGGNAPALPHAGATVRIRTAASQGTIQHVVIIVQENRSVDNLFQFLPGASTQSYGLNSAGQSVTLQPENLTARYDLGHSHSDWRTEFAAGGMNGFQNESCKGTCPANAAYGYVPQSQVTPYYSLAESYTFADDFFETDQGPSFPAHQYLVSGTSTVTDGSPNKSDSNPQTPAGKNTGGCDSLQGSLTWVLTPKSQQPPTLRTYPCFQRQALMNELDAAGITWKYYQATPGAGLWNAVDAIQSIWSNPPEMAANVVTPSSQVLTDIAGGNLASVVWITPTMASSDHPRYTDGSGPSWVGSIVNAIGASQYWNSTAIFVVWDDWGGWYDHVTPTVYNSFELGFRVPLIVVSPYAKTGYVSHVQHEFGSILKFTEETFGLPSLGTTDQRADDLLDCFNFAQHPRHYQHVRTQFPARYFFTQRSTGPVDD